MASASAAAPHERIAHHLKTLANVFAPEMRPTSAQEQASSDDPIGSRVLRRHNRFQRVNGRHSLRLRSPRRVGLPYGSYPRLLLAYLTTETVRTKKPHIHLGATPNDLARKLGLSTISGPRGTAARLEEQLRRLLCLRLDWQTTVALHPKSAGHATVVRHRLFLKTLPRELLPRRRSWRSEVVLTHEFFREVTRSSVPIDLRALKVLKGSPLAIDLYVWLTYRMSYLRKPTVIRWNSLAAQFGADYGRLRDFRERVLLRLEDVLRLIPSPPHVQRSRGSDHNSAPDDRRLSWEPLRSWRWSNPLRGRIASERFSS